MSDKENVTIDMYIYDEDKILEQEVTMEPQKAKEKVEKYIEENE